MQYHLRLAAVLLFLTIASAQAQVGAASGQGASGNVHVHVVYADDRRAGANLQVVLMQGSSSTPVGTTYTNDAGKANFGSLAAGDYHVVVSGEGIETTDSGVFEVDPRQVTQTQYVTVKPTQPAAARAISPKTGTVSASELKVPAKARKELDKANEAMERQDWTKAVELLNKATSIYPQYAVAYYGLAVSYFRMKDSVREQEALERAVSADAHFAPACENLAKLYLQKKEFSQAEALLDKALTTDPNNGEYWTLMADVQYMQHRYDAAIATAQKTHSLPGAHPATAHYIAAKAYEQKKQPQAALAQFELFLKEEPAGPRADRVRSDMAKMQSAGQSIVANAH